jgi:hypothetical protein
MIYVCSTNIVEDGLHQDPSSLGYPAVGKARTSAQNVERRLADYAKLTR